jgi:hypothetical protein
MDNRHRYKSDHDGTQAFVADTLTGERAYFPDSAAAYKAGEWLNTGITPTRDRYHWVQGRNSVYINLGNGDWGHAQDIVTVEISDSELEQIAGMSDEERIGLGHERYHQQMSRPL